VLLAVAVTLVVSLLIAADVNRSGPTPWAHGWSVALGALLLVRRRYPVLVVALSVVAVIGYYVAGNPPIGVAVPVAAAVFSAAEYGRMVAAAVASILLVAVSVIYRLTDGQDPGFVIGYELPGHAILLAGAIALGDSVRARRELRRQAAEIAALVAERYRHETEQQVLAERLALARELHDSVGHALTVVSLHTEVAQEAAGAADDDGVEAALQVISETTAATFADLRRTVADLRQQDPAERSEAPVASLAVAVRPAEQAGLEVGTRVQVRTPLPAGVEAAVLRIVQESITNVVRHARASRVEVSVVEADSTVTVRVENDHVGSGALPRLDRPGHGISGMRERTHLLGGTFSAGPLPSGSGWLVQATIPTEEGP